MNWIRPVTCLLFVGAIGWGLAELLHGYVPDREEVGSSSESLDSGAGRSTIFDRLAESPDNASEDLSGGWRRTANGWEHVSTWPVDYSFKRPAFHPLIFVALQILVILFVVVAFTPDLVARGRNELLSSVRILKQPIGLKAIFVSEKIRHGATGDAGQLNPIIHGGHRFEPNRHRVES